MNTRGQTINQAYEAVQRTYQEINRLKDDLQELLLTYESSLRAIEQYSLGTNSLYLKANHIFLFKSDELKPEIAEIKEQRLFAMICIFYRE